MQKSFIETPPAPGGARASKKKNARSIVFVNWQISDMELRSAHGYFNPIHDINIHLSEGDLSSSSSSSKPCEIELIHHDSDEMTHSFQNNPKSDVDREFATAGPAHPFIVYVYNPWILVLRIGCFILFLITITEAIMSALLNHYSNNVASAMCSFFSFMNVLATLQIVRSWTILDYRFERIVFVCISLFAMSAMISASFAFKTLSTMMGCVGGTNHNNDLITSYDFYLLSTSTSEEYTFYYDQLTHCAQRDPYAFRNCNCINRQHQCMTNIQATVICEDMLEYSPSLAEDIYYFSIAQLTVACILTLLFLVTIRDVTRERCLLEENDGEGDHIGTASIMAQTGFYVDAENRRPYHGSTSNLPNTGNNNGCSFIPVNNPMYENSLGR
jgi:hypothetical protein